VSVLSASINVLFAPVSFYPSSRLKADAKNPVHWIELPFVFEKETNKDWLFTRWDDYVKN